jgi:hypothetical protein
MDILDVNVKITCRLDEYLVSVRDANGITSRAIIAKEKILSANNQDDIFRLYIGAAIKDYMDKAKKIFN